MTRFRTRQLRATVADAHGEVFPEVVRPEIWFIEPTDAAIVLGSTQALTTLDLGEVARRGLGVVRRHSGGGAVLVEPHTSSWFDVWIPVDDERFERDVSRSAIWLGEIVVDALAAVGHEGVVASATELSGRWSPLVCFAGVAAGEVLVEGRKAVGISQRRTRAGARFQVTILHEMDPARTAGLFALGPADRAELAAVLRAGVQPVAVDPLRLRDALEAAFSRG